MAEYRNPQSGEPGGDKRVLLIFAVVFGLIILFQAFLFKKTPPAASQKTPQAQTTEITGDGKKVNGLVYKDLRSGETKSVELEGVFVQIGLVPNTEWLKGTVELSKHGEIVVDARGATSVPGVFAAGDVTTVPFKQIVIAVGEGAKASLSAFDHLIRHGDEVEVASEAEAEATV